MDDRIPSYAELSGLSGPLAALFSLDQPHVRASYDVDADTSEDSPSKRAQYELKVQRRLADLFSQLEALERFNNPGVGLTVSGWKDAEVIRNAIKVLAETVNTLARRWGVSWKKSLIGGFQPVRADKTRAMKLDADAMHDFRTASNYLQGAFAREQPEEKAGLLVDMSPTITPTKEPRSGAVNERIVDSVVGDGLTASSIPNRTDFAALAASLRERNKGQAARLVEFMEHRDSASYSDIADAVHGDPKATDNAIRKMLVDARRSLAELGSRLSFHSASSHVHKTTHIE